MADCDLLTAAEADRAAAEADAKVFFQQRLAASTDSLGAPPRGLPEDVGVAMHSTLLEAPQALQGNKLRLGKKVAACCYPLAAPVLDPTFVTECVCSIRR